MYNPVSQKLSLFLLSIYICICVFILFTAIFGVKGSYPEAPEAKPTPVRRSLDLRFGSKYAGTYPLIPNSSAAMSIELIVIRI
jgi:hypothetical protein